MTQKEKAERYDEAIERAEKALEVLGTDKCEGARQIFSLFPELKESEEERIREGLIQYFKKFKLNTFAGIEPKNILSWLEKQKESSFLSKDEEYTLSRIIEYLEDNDCPSEWKDLLYDVYALPYQKEQKPADKVEPKFYKGEWLCENEPNNYARFIQILEIVNVQGKERYRISRDLHNDEDIVECRFVENNYHPFNILDAKDGDVLHSTGFHNDCIFIFNRLDNWKFDEPNGDRAVATGYCCLSISADKMEFGIQGPDCVEVNTIKPATKIQRDLLFQKMKEAGYEWDAEKLTLKKIEDNDIERKKEALLHKKRMDIQIGVCCPNIMKDNYIQAYREGIDAAIEHILHLKPQNTWKPSDDQMYSLKNALNVVIGERSEYHLTIQELRSLYDDLKKLKED